MSTSVSAIIGFAAGAGTTFVVTPLAIRLASRLGFYDRPAGYKQHREPTPYLGGFAVLVGLLVGVLATGSMEMHYLPIILGGAVIWGLGTTDDRFNLNPFLRVAAEVALGGWLWSEGLGWHLVSSDVVNLLVTIGWVVVVVNAFNLTDNIDGACATTGLVAALGLGGFALVNNDPVLAAVSFALAGACAGFLPSNLSRPAKIFLGDGGSMVIGFGLAAVAMSGPATSDLGTGAVLAASIVIGLPLLDTALVVTSRIRRRAPILTGGRDHLTHRLLGLVGTPAKVCLVFAAVGAVLSASAMIAGSESKLAVLWVTTTWAALGIGTIAVLEWGGRAPAPVAGAVGERSG